MATATLPRGVTVFPINGEIYYVKSNRINSADLRNYERRYPGKPHRMSENNIVHRHKACAGRGSRPLSWSEVETLWEHGQWASEKEHARLIGWCDTCCTKRKATA